MGRKKKFFFANDGQNNSKKEYNKEDSSENIAEKKSSSAENAEKQVENRQFQVFGQDDILLNKTEFIDYQKISNKMLFLQFHLMGQFDSKGRYYIKEDIKKDLVHVQKEIQEEDDRGFVAEMSYAKVRFNFEVEIEYKDAEAKASLFIIEKVDDQTIKTLLDSFSDANDADFRIKVRQRFNLVDVAVAVRDEEVPNLNIWIYWQNEEYLYWKDLYEMGSQFFVLRALSLLAAYGELGEKIIEHYNTKLSQFEDSLPNRKYTKAKEILDEVLCEFGGIEKVDEGKGKLQTLAKEFNKPFYVSVQTQAMLFEKDSTKEPASTKAGTKQEEYGWGDNGKFKSAAAGKFGSAQGGKKASSKASKKTIWVAISPNNNEEKTTSAQKEAENISPNQQSTQNNSNGQQKQEDLKSQNEDSTKSQDKVDGALMKAITDELDQDHQAISSEQEIDQFQVSQDGNGQSIPSNKEESEATRDVEMV